MRCSPSVVRVQCSSSARWERPKPGRADFIAGIPDAPGEYVHRPCHSERDSDGNGSRVLSRISGPDDDHLLQCAVVDPLLPGGDAEGRDAVCARDGADDEGFWGRIVVERWRIDNIRGGRSEHGVRRSRLRAQPAGLSSNAGPAPPDPRTRRDHWSGETAPPVRARRGTRITVPSHP